jgi:hypothetical protein
VQFVLVRPHFDVSAGTHYRPGDFTAGEHRWVPYVVPMLGLGWLLELYHSLLQWGIIPEAITRCVATVPCTTKYINYFGFVTIPFLGLLAFTAIGACVYFYYQAITTAGV